MRAGLIAAAALATATPSGTALVTSYCPGSSGEITASGEHVHPGIVATESRSIPFGSRVTFTLAVLGRRTYIVEDRMGLGDRASFDVWASTCTASDSWGARVVHYVVTYPRSHR
jgi:3D (Asp-Asp-Asp) domain-containing protein